MNRTKGNLICSSMVVVVTLINLISVVSILLVKFAQFRMPVFIDILIFVNPFVVVFCFLILLVLFVLNKNTIHRVYLYISLANTISIIALYMYIFMDYARTMSNF